MSLPPPGPQPRRPPGWRQLVAAITFYTTLPLPAIADLEFAGIARWVPAVGLLVGGLLALSDLGLRALGMPALPRSALLVGEGIFLTGGLHLDGAMDTADGLAVMGNREQRLAVMADSRSGAFGVMAAVAIFTLKTTSIAYLSSPLGLVSVAIWGRWGQLLAIAAYPYLRPAGKGALHKASLRLPQDLGFGGGWVGGWLLCLGWFQGWQTALLTLIAGGLLSWGVGAWLQAKLGGQTGDTYGAIVEWTEALLLCLLTLFA